MQGKALCMLVGCTGLATVLVCISVNVECFQVLEGKSHCQKEVLSSDGGLHNSGSRIILDWSCAKKRMDE